MTVRSMCFSFVAQPTSSRREVKIFAALGVASVRLQVRVNVFTSLVLVMFVAGRGEGNAILVITLELCWLMGTVIIPFKGAVVQPIRLVWLGSVVM